MSSFPVYLFAYGTLQRGFTNARFMNGCTFVAPGKTVDKFSLYVGEFPFVTAKANESQISGEIYQVPDEETLKMLDDFENHPVLYTRGTTHVLNEETNEIIISEIYFNEVNDIQKEGVELVSSGKYGDSKKALLLDC
jgi:gamma-glutamylaminecyclotransferase